jgi:hypothetical protein
MAVSDDLYDLIESLSMSEKRYLRIFSSRHVKGEKNIYLRLFDTITSLRQPDDDAVKQALSDSDMRSNITKHKHYLYNLILRSLNAYHAEHSLEARFRETMRSVEILYQRGLYGQSRKLLRRASRMAEELQRIPELLVVSEWEQNLLSKTSQYGAMTDLLERDGQLIAELGRERQVKLLVFRVYDRLLRLGAQPEAGDMAELRQLMEHPLMASGTGQRYHIRYLVSMANMVCANAMDDRDAFLTHCTETVRVFDEHPVFASERPNLFAMALINRCKALLQVNELGEVSEILGRLRLFPEMAGLKGQAHVLANIIYETTHIDLLCCLRRLDLARADSLLREAEPELDRCLPTVTLSLAMSLRFDAAYMYFLLGKYDRCLVWLNRLLNDEGYRVRMQLYAVARLFSMAVHVRLGNDSLVDYTARSIKDELKKWGFAKATATSLVRFFPRYLKAKDVKIQRKLMADLVNDLQRIRDEGIEHDVYDTFDFALWAQAMLEGRPMVDLLRLQGAKGR